jgi:hypothetical protein
VRPDAVWEGSILVSVERSDFGMGVLKNLSRCLSSSPYPSGFSNSGTVTLM